jgi:long-chain acyl-CoA synthetase
MSVYDERPWLSLYDEDLPADLELEHQSGLEMFRASVERAPDRQLIRYFGRGLTVADTDAMTDALAAGLGELGVRGGDRVAIYLQNVPQFVLSVLGAWKAGAIAVPINPMLKERELELILTDSGARALITLESLYGDVAERVVPATDVEHVLTTSELELIEGEPRGVLAGAERTRHDGTRDLLELVRAHDGEKPDPPRFAADDVAFLTYTSGTTGPPKGAMNTHGNVVFNAQVYRDWIHLDESDVVLGVAPLFHITGLIGHLAVALLVPMPLVLPYRFDPVETLELIERERCTFTVASITVFTALMNAEGIRERDLSSFTKVYSGGAPIAPATVESFEELTGAYIHNIYGLTETTSPSHAVPFARRAPVDEGTGALSVGVPVPGTVVRDRRRRGRRPAAGRGRGARDERTRGRTRLLGEARGVGEDDPGRPAPHGGRGPDGRRGLVLSGRSPQGPDQRLRVQGLAAGGRGLADVPPGGARGRRRRCPRRVPRRDRQGVREREARRAGGARCAHLVLQGAHGRLQVPAPGRGGRRAAQDGDRQDPAPRAARSGARADW